MLRALNPIPLFLRSRGGFASLLLLAVVVPNAMGQNFDVCDFSGSGHCDIADLDLLLYEGISTQSVVFDLNNDDGVDIADRNEWLHLVGTVPGDANLDGMVDASDLNSLGTNWRRTDATSAAQGDFNGDGDVDATDLNDVGNYWQFGVPAAAAQAAVPEPSSLGLLAPLALLFVVRRQATRRS